MAFSENPATKTAEAETQNADPLLAWNEFNKSTTKQNLINCLFGAISTASPTIDRFSTWLLAGTGATAALLVAHMDAILPFLSPTIFKVCGLLLLVSGVVGFIAKYKAIQCQIASNVLNKIAEAIGPILEKHNEGSLKIATHAKARGLELETDVDMDGVIREFIKPFPALIRWLIARKLAKQPMQTAYLLPFKACLWQGYLCLLQTAVFIAFVIIAFWFAHPAP